MSHIVFNKITKKFRTGIRPKTALKRFTLTVEPGEVFGFLGPNGAGKSTAIKLLLNFIRPDAGQLTIKGRPVQEPEVRRSIGYLSENPYFYDHLTAAELLRFGGRASGSDRATINKRTNELLTRLNLVNVKHQPVRTYSKGMTQRIGLALALIHDPEILILDEPMSGLDPLGRRLVADLILELHKAGKTVFFSSHIMSDIEQLCDRIGIIHKGALLFSGPLQEFVGKQGGLEKAFIDLIDDYNGPTI